MVNTNHQQLPPPPGRRQQINGAGGGDFSFSIPPNSSDGNTRFQFNPTIPPVNLYYPNAAARAAAQQQLPYRPNPAPQQQTTTTSSGSVPGVASTGSHQYNSDVSSPNGTNDAYFHSPGSYSVSPPTDESYLPHPGTSDAYGYPQTAPTMSTVNQNGVPNGSYNYVAHSSVPNSSLYPQATDLYSANNAPAHSLNPENGTATSDSYPSAAGSRKRPKVPVIPEDEVEEDEDEQEQPAKRPSGACHRCKGLKVRCDFPPDADACKKCMQSGSECFIPGRKKRRPPAKRDELMKQIRLKDSLIEQLLEQLEARSSVLAPLSLGGSPGSSLHNQQAGTPTDPISSAALQAAEEKREREIAEWIKRARATIMQTREASNLLGGDANPLLEQDEADDDSDDDEYHSNEEESGGGVAVEGPNGQIVDPSLHNNGGKNRADRHASPASVSHHSVSGSNRTSTARREVQGSALPSVAPFGFLENMGKKLRKRRSSGGSGSGSGGEEENLGVANPFFFAQSIKPSIVMDEDQFQLPQILAKGIVTPNDVGDLFNTYFDCMNLSTCLLDDRLYTPEKTLYRSPFLFTVICAIASRYHPGRKDLYPILMNHARLAAGTALISGRKSLEVCQAYILMAQYPIPARRWSEDRSWMFLGCAIRMATDLNLHHPPVLNSGRTATTIDTIMEQEGQAREILNRTRAWLSCFNIDKATSTQFGKPTTLREDWMFPLLQRNMAEGGAEWWCPSPFAAKFDIHLCAYSALLREIAAFHEQIYSDPTNPSGVNEKIDFEKVTYDFDDKIEQLGEQWFLRVDTHMNKQDPQCIFRKGLLKLEFYYNQLVALSFGFQHAFRRGAVQKDNQFLLRCHAAASRVVSIVVDELAPQKYMRYCPESHFIFATFASAFLLKLLRPKFSTHLEAHQQTDILHLVDRLVKTLSEVAMDDRHAPKLYSRFIAGLLKKAHKILIRGTASVSSVSSMSSPESVGDPTPAGSGDTLTPGDTQATGASSDPSSYNMEGVQNALPANVWPYGFSESGENNDTLASMQFFDDNQFWEDGLLPGFTWTGSGPIPAGDNIIADAAFLEQQLQMQQALPTFPSSRYGTTFAQPATWGRA